MNIFDMGIHQARQDEIAKLRNEVAAWRGTLDIAHDCIRGKIMGKIESLNREISIIESFVEKAEKP